MALTSELLYYSTLGGSLLVLNFVGLKLSHTSFASSSRHRSDLHEFDFTLSQWSAVPAAGRRPRSRYRATAVAHKNMMILYGGHDG
jgi:hypothetical protein